MASLPPSATRFVCKHCNQVTKYDFSPIEEEEWKNLQEVGKLSGSKETEQLMEKSFVFVNEHLNNLQNAQLSNQLSNNRDNDDKKSQTDTNINTNTNSTDNNNNNSNQTNTETNLNSNSNQNSNLNPTNDTLNQNESQNDSSNNDTNKNNDKSINDNNNNNLNNGKLLNGNNNNNNIDTNPNAFSQSLQVLEDILSICGGHTHIDYPLCEQCMNVVMKKLTNELEELNLEQRIYNDFISQYEQSQKGVKTNSQSLRQRNVNNYEIDFKHEKEALNKETRELQERLKEISHERNILSTELSELDMESLRMDEYEELFFCDANDFYYAIENLSHKHAAVRQKIREVSSHLEIMKRTNVFDDAFHIHYEGHFGTINGLRLGKLASVNNDWEEINAGFGQCILLLDVLAQRCKVKNFSFEKYELNPMGSCSFIREKKSNGNGKITHHMYGSTGLFGYKQCDKALECFLDCIRQFADWIATIDPNFTLKYQIKGHEVGDVRTNKMVSIRFASHTEEQWTQALKYMVIDLKYLLAWVARYSP